MRQSNPITNFPDPSGHTESPFAGREPGSETPCPCQPPPPDTNQRTSDRSLRWTQRAHHRQGGTFCRSKPALALHPQRQTGPPHRPPGAARNKSPQRRHSQRSRRAHPIGHRRSPPPSLLGAPRRHQGRQRRSAQQCHPSHMAGPAPLAATNRTAAPPSAQWPPPMPPLLPVHRGRTFPLGFQPEPCSDWTGIARGV